VMMVASISIGRREGLNLNAFSFQDLPHKSLPDYHNSRFLSLGLLSPLFPVPALAPRDAIGPKDSDFGRYNAFRFCP